MPKKIETPKTQRSVLEAALRAKEEAELEMDEAARLRVVVPEIESFLRRVVGAYDNLSEETKGYLDPDMGEYARYCESSTWVGVLRKTSEFLARFAPYLRGDSGAPQRTLQLDDTYPMRAFAQPIREWVEAQAEFKWSVNSSSDGPSPAQRLLYQYAREAWPEITLMSCRNLILRPNSGAQSKIDPFEHEPMLAEMKSIRIRRPR